MAFFIFQPEKSPETPDCQAINGENNWQLANHRAAVVQVTDLW
jgi:hypothetical protein